MLWFLLGILLVLAVRNQFDLQGVKRDVQKIARGVRKVARELARTIRQAVKEARTETAESRKAGAEKPAKVIRMQPAPAAEKETAAAPAQAAAPPDAQAEKKLLNEMELNARAAAMLASVPTISFPEDDPKYDSSRKYRLA